MTLKKKISLAIFLPVISFFICTSLQAKGLEYKEFDVRFTNPQCADYVYPEPIRNVDDTKDLFQKPANTYCSGLDSRRNSGRKGTPSEKLKQWVQDTNTKEIFLAFLSWSNSYMTKVICNEINSRPEDNLLKITALIDGDTAKLDWLKNECVDEERRDLIQYEKRGHKGGINYAHNKMFLVNPNGDSEYLQFTFGSGNFSSGIHLHHENWNFVTVKRESYFAQGHLCLMNGMLDHHYKKKAYSDYLRDCLAEAREKYEPEDDISFYFVPSYFAYDLTNRVVNKIEDPDTEEILIAAHRFSYWKFIEPLRDRLSWESNKPRPCVHMIFDDDMYWTQQEWKKVGDNTTWEARRVEMLQRFGAKARFVQTNHHGGHFVHHNKVFIFNTHNHRYNAETDTWHEASLEKLQEDGAAVLTGAANFTHTAYGDKGHTPNFENIYYIEIPEIAKKYKEQYVHLWENLATPPGDMPEWDMEPVRD
ncbi:hypothetical protein ACFLRA_02090 [Bdellovibrionota bacterium]